MANTVDQNIKNMPPLSNNEWEIVTIGNEARCGEAVLVHMPNGKWLIIDSCVTNLYKRVNSNTCRNQNLPLLYLEWRNQQLSDVEIIVCTHWHRDHCTGMSTLLLECETATFVHAKHSKDFVEKYFDILSAGINSGSIDEDDEFSQCMSLITGKKTKRESIYATMDKVISDDFDIATLSPTDNNSDEYDQSVLKRYGVKGYHLLKDANSTSISLSIRNKDMALLFGADLSISKPPQKNGGDSKEVDFNERERTNLSNILSTCQSCPYGEDGWCFVCHKSKILNRQPKYQYIKIPHHSSSTGYCKKLYEDYVSPKATGVSTTYASSQLPSQTMLDKLKEHLNEIYVTDKSASTLKANVDPRIEAYLNSLEGVKLLEHSKEIGIVVSNFRKGKWETHCYGNAYAEKERKILKICKFIKQIIK